MAASRSEPRLPGVCFTVKEQPPDETLPRMDISVFVGFAAAGELHTPTAVESVEEFSHTFGDDLVLAWDAGRGEPVYAQLSGAVRNFFRNGGRRCWIIRVQTPAPGAFNAGVFLDERLKGAGVERLLAEAEFFRDLSAPQPRPLFGIYAALDVEEATLIAVPDAGHRSWSTAVPVAPPRALPSPPLVRPQWWHFLDCHEQKPFERVREPRWGNFLDCSILIVAPPRLDADTGLPELDVDTKSSETGTFRLSWTTSAPVEEAQYVLEEATGPDFNDAAVLYTGPDTQYSLYGRKPGDYYYRVRLETGGNTSDWSNGFAVRVVATPSPAVQAEENYSADALLAVQRALLRVCAARGDLFAVLSLPEHYREQQAQAHVSLLRATRGRASATEGVEPLGDAEARSFSYGAVYHPWLLGREETRDNEIRRTPPCGAVCGVFAHRSLTRGAWVAPANEPLRGVFALAPPLSAARLLTLQEARLNVVRQEPRGFLVLDADTLSKDGDLRPLTVRRLLILLRRLALRLGMTYAFEPHNAEFRRAVQRAFEGLLERMFVRGAFAGAAPDDAYRVVVDETLNTPREVGEGRFIVELRVAPSLPLTFLTVRLIQTGERGVIEGV